jgi:uncharacterized membrane protein YdjX (TVP38/TMEM64 family)
LAVAVAILAGLTGATVAWWRPLWQTVADPQRFRKVITGYGAGAPLAFIVAQVVQVVIFFIPGEVTQVAGGYLVGAWRGLLYTYIGITLGSLTAFYLARLFEHAVLDWLVDRDTVRQFDRIVYGKSGFWPMFILFLIPGIPKDLLCYIAGLTPMHVVLFLAISTVGRFPGILLSSLFGGGLAERDWGGLALSTSLGAGLVGVVYVFRGSIERFRRAHLVTGQERALMGTPPDRRPPAP